MVKFSDRFGKKKVTMLAAAVLLAAGGSVGAGAMYAARPVAVMGPVALTPIGSLANPAGPLAGDTVTSVRGTVAAVYGSRFILRDPSGTALVETGPRRNDALVATGQTVTVQGRFDDSVLHATFLVGADGKVTALEPRGPHHGDGPHGPRGGPGGPGGPGDDRERGPGDRADAPPPPPAAQSGNGGAPAPVAAPTAQ